MLETRTFSKIMNNDVALELMPNGQYKYSLNHNIENDGLLHSTLGNTLITNIDIPLPAGDNVIIGSKENMTNNCVYFFNYNSLGQHRILRFNEAAKSITTLMEETTPPILNFSTDHLITSIDFFYLDKDNLMIYWADDNLNPPRKINERRALGYMNRWVFQDNFDDVSTNTVGFMSTTPPPFVKGDKIKIVQNVGFTNSSYNNYATVTDVVGNYIVTDIPFGQSTPPQGGYVVYDWAYSVIEEQTIDRLKWQPKFAPTIQPYKENSFPRNNINNNLLQFTSRYIYDDYEKSTLSSYSEVALNGQSKYNAIDIRVNSGAANVRKVQILVRSKTSDQGVEVYNDTYIVKTFDKEELSIQDNSTILFTYYNDTILTPVSLTEQQQLFDWVPKKCGASSAISGNRITDGDVTEQFDLVKPDVKLSAIHTSFTTIPLNLNVGNTLYYYYCGGTYIPTGESISFFSQSSNLSALSGSIYLPSSIGLQNGGTFGQTSGSSANISNGHVINLDPVVEIQLPITPVTIPSSLELSLSDGTVISIAFTTPDVSPPSNYPFTPINNIYSWLAANGFTSYYGPQSSHSLLVKPKQLSNGQIVTILSAKIVSGADTSVLAFKNGATHCIGIEYVNRGGQECTVVKDDNMSIYIPFKAINQVGTYSYIQAVIKHLPPIWATHYRFLYTKNTTIATYFQIEAATKTVSSNNFIKVNINFYTSFNLSYSFVKGDRLRIIKKGGNYLDDAFIVDVPIESYNVPTYEVTCKTTGPLTIYAGDIVEIYTPKSSTSEQIYYELGNKEYEIFNPHTVNRSHQGSISGHNQIVINGVSTFPATVYLDRGDTYFRDRNFASPYPIAVIEDANYTDAYASAVTDCGRPNIVDANYREVRRESTIYYSGQLIQETSINGLSTVNAGNFQTYDLSYGPVMRMINKEQFLKVFQQYKIGSVPINQSISQGQAGNLAANNDVVLNEIRYRVGNFGLSHKESLATYGFADYGFDVNRGVIIRDSNDGVDPLSQLYGLNTFTTDISQQIRSSGLNIRVYGVYNKIWSQYEMCIADHYDKKGNKDFTGATVAFVDRANPQEKGFAGFYSYNSNGMCSSNMDIVSFKGGNVYLHNDNPVLEYYGVPYSKELWVVFNEQVLVEKNQKAILEETSDIYEMYAIDNGRGQDTNLITDDFKLLGTGFCASLWKNSNTPNVTDPLFNGDEIKGFVMMGKFINSNPFLQTKITTIGIEQIPVLRSGF